MIEYIGRGATWLDAWLREHIGRAYSGILGVGLVLSLIASMNSLSTALGSGVSLLKIAGLVVFQLLLLINQLAQFHEFRHEARQRRAERKSRRTPPTPPRA